MLHTIIVTVCPRYTGVRPDIWLGLVTALTHIVRFFYRAIFFALDHFLLHDFCLEFATKNAACVNGTIEITLEQIQHDIVANS